MNNDSLQELVEKVSIESFDRAFEHQAYFNKRLRTTGGRYMLNTHHIEVNFKYYEAFGEEELIGIIKHELCHYHLHLTGKGYKHGDQEFKALLKRVGAPRYCSSLPSIQQKNKNVFYRCKDCNYLYERKRKVDITKYRCGRCKGSLLLLEKGVDS
jgi:SprT-like protein